MNELDLYTVKVWRTEWSQVETRTDVPWGLATAIAVRAGWYKTQVVNSFGIIELEIKNDGIGANCRTFVAN